jgi:hypothetical protein
LENYFEKSKKKYYLYNMLFRPVRLLIIFGIAFTAGIIYEKQKYKEICGEMGGVFNEAVCKVQIQE